MSRARVVFSHAKLIQEDERARASTREHTHKSDGQVKRARARHICLGARQIATNEHHFDTNTKRKLPRARSYHVSECAPNPRFCVHVDTASERARVLTQ